MSTTLIYRTGKPDLNNNACVRQNNRITKGKIMKKRMIAMLLVLVMCFGLLAMTASADTGFGFSLDMFKKSFELPDTIAQLLDMFQLTEVWNFIKSVIEVFRGLDQLL